MSDLPDFRSDDPHEIYQTATLMFQDYVANYRGDEEKANILMFALERAMAALTKDMEALVTITDERSTLSDLVSGLIRHQTNLDMRLAIMGLKTNLLIDFSPTFKEGSD